MDINPSTSLHGHLASQLQITTSRNCPVHVPPSCPQRYHKGPSKHLVEKSRFVMSTLFPWCTNLVTLSPLDKNTMPFFFLLCLIHLIPDGNHFMTFYSFITFPVSPWHHFPPILGLQKATKVKTLVSKPSFYSHRSGYLISQPAEMKNVSLRMRL